SDRRAAELCGMSAMPPIATALMRRVELTQCVESRCGAVAVGRTYLLSASFVWRCLSGSTMTPFPHPAHRTGQADLPHPALGQDLTPLLSRATPSAVSEPFAEFIGFPISQVLHHVLHLS